MLDVLECLAGCMLHLSSIQEKEFGMFLFQGRSAELISDLENDSGRDIAAEFVKARTLIVNEVGLTTIRSLHQRKDYLPYIAIALTFLLLITNVYLLGTVPPLSIGWILLFSYQGFLIQHLGYLSHEFGVHQTFNPKALSYILGVLCNTLLFKSYSAWREVHLKHHKETGAEWDEDFLFALDMGRWQKILYLTFLGGILFYRPSNIKYAQATMQKIKTEKRIIVIFMVVFIALMITYPIFTFYGYILPLLIVLPIANSTRMLLEHAVTIPDNVLQCATYYRTNIVTRYLFFWAGGDCHLVHHLFPNIPFYNMGRAVEVLRPILLRNGAYERTSIFGIYYDWIVGNMPYRTFWDADKVDSPLSTTGTHTTLAK